MNFNIFFVQGLLLLLCFWPSYHQISIPQNIFPVNVTGDYVGEWNLMPNTSSHYQNAFGNIYYCRLRDIILKESVTRPELTGFRFVVGNFFIRDGKFFQGNLESFMLFGIYDTLNGTFQFYLIPLDISNQISVGMLLETADPFIKNDTLTTEAFHLGMKQYRFPKPKRVQSFNRPPKPLCIFVGIAFSNTTTTTIPSGNNPSTQVLSTDDPTDISSQVSLIDISGNMSSSKCQISIQFHLETFDKEVFYLSRSQFAVAAILITVIELLLIVYQINFTTTQASYARISLLTIGSQAMLDCYSCLIHMGISILYDRLFKLFALESFLLFLLFSVFEMRYLVSIWRSRRPQAFTEWTGVRQEFQILYTRFYGSLFLCLFLLYQMRNIISYAVLLLHSFWIPQIYCNFVRDCRKSLSPLYVIGTSICRLMLPLYFFGCPYNLFAFEPDLTFCLVLVSWVSFQVGLLLCQHYFGPRFFIPKFLLPKKHDYYRTVNLEDPQQNVCVICMGPVSEKYMVTPCNHVFHEYCLKRWMDEKLTCPVCRTELPEY